MRRLRGRRDTIGRNILDKSNSIRGDPELKEAQNNFLLGTWT